jgi:hypothetical protein
MNMKQIIYTSIEAAAANYICVLLEYYAAYNGDSVQTFRDNLQVSFSRANKASSASPLKVVPIFLHVTSVRK